MFLQRESSVKVRVANESAGISMFMTLGRKERERERQRVQDGNLVQKKTSTEEPISLMMYSKQRFNDQQLIKYSG